MHIEQMMHLLLLTHKYKIHMFVQINFMIYRLLFKKITLLKLVLNKMDLRNLICLKLLNGIIFGMLDWMIKNFNNEHTTIFHL